MLETEMPMGVDAGRRDVGIRVGDGGDANIELLYTLLAQKVFEPGVEHRGQSAAMVAVVDIDRSFSAILKCGALMQGVGISIGHRLSGGFINGYKIRVACADFGDASGKFL
mgnify:FL=1